MLQAAGKATLFATAISLITGGSQVIRENFNVGLVLLLVGVALIIVWSILIDVEAKAEARKTVYEALQKLEKESKQNG
jgi:hypothetical protein